MLQYFSRPDRYLARCGRLDAAVVERRIDGAPEFLRGLRALFISDPHVLNRTTQADLDGFAGRISSLEADLLLLGGDYGDTAENAERFFRSLKGIRAPLGIFGVLGNNDSEAWDGRAGELHRVMSQAGCTLLVNRSAAIDRNGGRIWIGGMDDSLHGRPETAGLYPDRARPDAYRILLSHYPVAPDRPPDLMLCGHTHGGQFNLLGVTPFSIGFERLCRSKPRPVAIAGLHEFGNTKLLVSKGIGASRLQLRICVRPEMDLLIFG